MLFSANSEKSLVSTLAADWFGDSQAGIVVRPLPTATPTLPPLRLSDAAAVPWRLVFAPAPGLLSPSSAASTQLLASCPIALEMPLRRSHSRASESPPCKP